MSSHGWSWPWPRPRGGLGRVGSVEHPEILAEIDGHLCREFKTRLVLSNVIAGPSLDRGGAKES